MFCGNFSFCFKPALSDLGFCRQRYIQRRNILHFSADQLGNICCNGFRTLHDQFVMDLQQKLGLEVNPNVPIIGMVGRLSNQKGLDLVDCVLGDIMNENVQLVVLGMGEARYTNLFSWAEQQYQGKMAARFAMDHQLAHRLYASADFFLMPSLFEPCGLSQMIASRYGAFPVTRETGGLYDSIKGYWEDGKTIHGNGFTFANYEASELEERTCAALELYEKEPEKFAALRYRALTSDFSWDASAEKYMEMYQNM